MCRNFQWQNSMTDVTLLLYGLYADAPRKSNNDGVYIQSSLLHLPTQMRFLIGGERVTCRGLNLSNSLGRIKLTNSLRKQQLELWTRT